MPEVNDRFYIKQGNTLPVLRGTFVDPETLAPLPIAGATLELHVRDSDGLVIIAAGTPVNLDNGTPALRGRWEYQFTADETAVPGEYEGEVEATFLSGILSAPNTRNFLILITEWIAP